MVILYVLTVSNKLYLTHKFLSEMSGIMTWIVHNWLHSSYENKIELSKSDNVRWYYKQSSLTQEEM